MTIGGTGSTTADYKLNLVRDMLAFRVASTDEVSPTHQSCTAPRTIRCRIPPRIKDRAAKSSSTFVFMRLILGCHLLNIIPGQPNFLSKDGTASLAITGFSRCGKYFAYGVSYSVRHYSTQSFHGSSLVDPREAIFAPFTSVPPALHSPSLTANGPTTAKGDFQKRFDSSNSPS